MANQKSTKKRIVFEVHDEFGRELELLMLHEGYRTMRQFMLSTIAFRFRDLEMQVYHELKPYQGRPVQYRDEPFAKLPKEENRS